MYKHRIIHTYLLNTAVLMVAFMGGGGGGGAVHMWFVQS